MRVTVVVRMLVCLVGGLVLLSGCFFGGGDDEGADAKGGGGQKQGTSQSQWLLSGTSTRIDVLSLDKTSEKAVTARLRITNFGGGRLQFSQFTDLGLSLFGPRNSAAAFTLVDSVNRKRYYPWFEKDGKCLCTLEGALGSYLEPGETFEYFASFPVPPVREVMLMVPNTPPFINVPVSDRPGPVKPPPGQEERDPAKVALSEPNIVPLIDHSEALDGSGEQTEDDRTVEVRLSADVLFALNKADLSPRARSALQNVAARINSSKATVVKIDGYTDDSGDDAINTPLSQRRAQAVQQALTPLVTKPGVTYQAAGHGSDDPVASNGSDDGRKRNRRVTISFAR